jgi:pimeloyl-ACP methyl ester carboxylesterase
MKIIIDNLLINYQDHGKGKSILFLHGWTPLAQKSAHDLTGELAKYYRMITPDLPGFGQSALPPESWGVPEYGVFIQKFMDKLGVKPDYVVAHSNGGTLAMYVLSNGLLMAQKLVLLSSAGIRGGDKLKKTLLQIVAKPVKLALIPLPQRTQDRIKKRMYGKLGSDLYVMGNMKPIFKRIVDYDIQSAATKVAQSTLLIYGKNDAATPVSYGETFAHIIPRARLEVVQNAGHYVHIDQPKVTTRLIKDFLA